LPARRLALKELVDEILHSRKACVKHPLLQCRRIVDDELEPRAAPRLLFVERVLGEIHAQGRAIRKGEGENGFS
jgi:hypothetical protein